MNTNKNNITLTSMDTNSINLDKKSINQSLIQLIYGDKNKIRNDLSSNYSNISKHNLNNEEEINLSLLYLLQNKNDIKSNKSNDMKNKNLEVMFKDLNKKLKMKEIEHKILYSGYINMYEDERKNKNIKHVNIINENNKDNNFEILKVYGNKGIINNNEMIKKQLSMKKIIDEDKYFYITNDNNIHKKIHQSKLFSQKKKKKI